MDKYSKAWRQMRDKGIDARLGGDGVVYVTLNGNGTLFEIELSHSDVEKWASVYDAEKAPSEVQKIKDADPYETLEEIARIFHYRGWDIGDGSTMDTDFIDSSDEFLGLVYQAFNPFHKK